MPKMDRTLTLNRQGEFKILTLGDSHDQPAVAGQIHRQMYL